MCIRDRLLNDIDAMIFGGNLDAWLYLTLRDFLQFYYLKHVRLRRFLWQPSFLTFTVHLYDISVKRFNTRLSGGDFILLTGILFVIALGVLIGVIAGVLMLLAVLAYLRQWVLSRTSSSCLCSVDLWRIDSQLLNSPTEWQKTREAFDRGA